MSNISFFVENFDRFGGVSGTKDLLMNFRFSAVALLMEKSRHLKLLICSLLFMLSVRHAVNPLMMEGSANELGVDREEDADLRQEMG